MNPRYPCAFVCAIFASGASAQGVQRCETPAGKVTYSNSACPEGTTAVRTLNNTAPPPSEDQQAAHERARREAAEAKSIDKKREQDEARQAKLAADRARAESKARGRCEQLRRDLQRARETRAGLERRAATVEKMQKADNEVGKREELMLAACK